MSTDSSKPALAKSNNRVLVIDDNPAIHDDFNKILNRRPIASQRAPGELEAELLGQEAPMEQRMRFRVDAALQGEEGLRMVEKALNEGDPYALIFVDLRMPPGWDGLETILQIWRRDVAIQAAICTASSDRSWEEAVAKLGENDRWVLLKKPFDAVEIRQVTSSLICKWNLNRKTERLVQGLEHLVEERTKELRGANQELAKQMVERKALEEELVRAGKLEALGRMAAGIGHEVSNPLAYLITSLELIEPQLGKIARRTPELASRELLEDMAAARHAAERIRTIVAELGSFCRGDREQQQDHGVADLTQVLDLACRMVDNEVKVRAHFERLFDKLPPVRGNANRLEQVFVNLLINAAKSIPEGDVVNNKITVAAELCGDFVEIRVSDTGCGIPEAELEHVLDPFYSRRSEGGMGMGLFLCHNILHSVGGSIELESIEREGTQVTVKLQISASLPDEVEEEDADEASGLMPVQVRVLVVDDEPLVANALARLLRDFDVEQVFGGWDAVNRCKKDEFDVIFCDLMMRDLSGMEVYEQLASLKTGIEERIIFITGGVFTEKARKFLKEVPNRVLNKPFRRSDVRKAIKEMVRSDD